MRATKKLKSRQNHDQAQSTFHFPLRVKWTVAVGLTIFLTLILFASVFYAAFNHHLLQQEEQTTSKVAQLVTKRLKPIKGNWTAEKAVAALTPNIAKKSDPANKFSDANASIYQDGVVRELARSDMAVVVYDSQAQKIFQTHQTPLLFKAVEHKQQQLQWHNQRRFLSLTLPVSTKGKSPQRLGYVFVVNRMDNLNQSTRRLRVQLAILTILAVLFSGLIGYLTVYRLSKRLHLISQTIAKIDRSPESTARIPQLAGNDEISELAQQFNEMLDEVQAYIEQQKEFVGDVSHELRTPIAVMQGHLQLLNRWGKDDPKVLAESLQAASQEATRMNSLVEEMLQLTRVEQFNSKTVKERVNVGEVMATVVNNMRLLHPDFQIRMDLERGSDVPVRMHRAHLEQILTILIDNAVKYSTARKEILLGAARDEMQVELVVQDFGMGISPEAQQRIFDRFYRVDKARSRARGGNGLGLAIAYRLARAYGGDISVKSIVDSGSVFRITLPVDQKPERKKANKIDTKT